MQITVTYRGLLLIISIAAVVLSSYLAWRNAPTVSVEDVVPTKEHAFQIDGKSYLLPLPEAFILVPGDQNTVSFTLLDRRHPPFLTVSSKPIGGPGYFEESKSFRAGKVLDYRVLFPPNGNGPQWNRIEGRVRMEEGAVLYVAADSFSELDAPDAMPLLNYLILLKTEN